jgi:hypothetical protein
MCNSVMQTSIARLGGVCGSVNSCKQRGTGWPAFFLGKICYMMGFLWFKITIIQLWLQICHGHFKLGTSCNVTHCDFNYLRLLCGSAKSFLLFRVDHVNLWRVEGRQALGDLDKLLSSMLAPDVKRWSQAILWRRALLSLGVALCCVCITKMRSTAPYWFLSLRYLGLCDCNVVLFQWRPVRFSDNHCTGKIWQF